MNYSNIKAYIESKIDAISTLSPLDASQVAVMAFQLARFNQSPSNISVLITHLQAQEADVDTADAVKSVTLLLGAASPSKAVVWKRQEFLSSGSFVVPDNLAGNLVYVTACGGGASGQAVINPPAVAGTASGGYSGCLIEKIPVQVSVGEIVPVTVGAGGPPSGISDTGAVLFASPIGAGGDTLFGSYLRVKGGSGEVGAYRSSTIAASGALLIAGPSFNGRYRGGIGAQDPLFPNAMAGGSAAGPFGDAPASKTLKDVGGSAGSAPDNSGAVGGSICAQNGTGLSITVTPGVGGSGRLFVEWQEFV